MNRYRWIVLTLISMTIAALSIPGITRAQTPQEDPLDQLNTPTVEGLEVFTPTATGLPDEYGDAQAVSHIYLPVVVQGSNLAVSPRRTRTPTPTPTAAYVPPSTARCWTR